MHFPERKAHGGHRRWLWLLFFLFGFALGCNRAPSGNSDNSTDAPQPIREAFPAATDKSQGADPEPVNARQGILQAFDVHPVVALSEAHGLKEGGAVSRRHVLSG
jgi:hypothetical protein